LELGLSVAAFSGMLSMASSGLKAEMTQGLIWHYNVPVPIQQVSGPQHGWYQAHDGGFAGKYL